MLKSMMKSSHLPQIALALLTCLALVSVAAASPSSQAMPGLVETVRGATETFKSAQAAEDAGYGLFHGCVSGPQEGAMGVHYVNGELVGDGAVDAQQPEALLYDMKDGELQLLGVEYVVLADDWNAKNSAPPMLMGQLFNYVGSPNRYGIPAFYELHVWAWKRNPAGMFADWNPHVTCEHYAAH